MCPTITRRVRAKLRSNRGQVRRIFAVDACPKANLGTKAGRWNPPAAPHPGGREPPKIFQQECGWFSHRIVARRSFASTRPFATAQRRGCVQISVAVFLALRDQLASRNHQGQDPSYFDCGGGSDTLGTDAVGHSTDAGCWAERRSNRQERFWKPRSYAVYRSAIDGPKYVSPYPRCNCSIYLLYIYLCIYPPMYLSIRLTIYRSIIAKKLLSVLSDNNC